MDKNSFLEALRNIFKKARVADVESIIEVYFVFQAEDGIRGGTVTGVQTCALPIFSIHAPT